MGFYISGLQRSGTNYLQALLIQNFYKFEYLNSKVKRDAWKHRIDPPDAYTNLLEKIRPDLQCFIMISKNPYTWIESLCFRNSCDYNGTQKHYGIAKYLSGDEPSIEYFGTNELSVIHLAKTWNHWAKSWLIDGNDEVNFTTRYFNRYEDLLVTEKREKFLDEIFEKLNLVKKHHEGWVNPKVGSISQSKNMTDKMVGYYTKMKPSKLDQQRIDMINEFITDEVFEVTGYKRI